MKPAKAIELLKLLQGYGLKPQCVLTSKGFKAKIMTSLPVGPDGSIECTDDTPEEALARVIAKYQEEKDRATRDEAHRVHYLGAEVQRIMGSTRED